MKTIDSKTHNFANIGNWCFFGKTMFKSEMILNIGVISLEQNSSVNFVINSNMAILGPAFDVFGMKSSKTPKHVFDI